MRKYTRIALILATAVLLSGCGDKSSTQKKNAETPSESSPETSSETEGEPMEGTLKDGTYLAEFDTDSGMFHVSEACDGKGTLTVENGTMTIHISLASKNIVNLYPGLAKDAAKEGAELLSPTEDTVTYSDGMTEEVYGFDVPVPALGTEFDLALIGTKGKWYDHKVSVSNPVPTENDNQSKNTDDSKKNTEANSADNSKNIDTLENGTYHMEITLEGGSGKAEILSPVTVTVTDQRAMATLKWNSPNYDYMIVNGEKYLPVNTTGNSEFELPVSQFDQPMDVIGDTVAMSKPHEVEYTLTFHSDTMKLADANTAEEPKAKATLKTTAETGTTQEKNTDLLYAKNFTIEHYEGGYTLLTTTRDGRQFFIVPEGKEAPKNINTIIGDAKAKDHNVLILQRPIKDIYLVASSVMDMFRELDGLSSITFSGQKESGWYIEEAREAMKKGEILYAGKYNRPDYEMIVSNHCSLAIENMMISHTPEVIEKLEDFDIPVLIDYSSYESHPLGRVEWVKFYGALLGKEKEAEQIFEKQAEILERVDADEKTEKTVAFFYITSNGLVQVRQSSDYIPKMIGLAGGTYIFENLGDIDQKRSTMNMQIEEFYAGAKDADFLIYNSSIDGGISSVKELLDKCELLADFKAVKEGNVFCTTNDLYQQSLSMGYLLEDIHAMIHKEKGTMNYLFHLD